MINWEVVPAFGEPPAQSGIVVRPSAYGILTNERGQIAVVRTSKGVFLPGGGIGAGETPEHAVIRETAEECGLEARLGTWRCAAVEYVFAAVEATHFAKRSIFYEGHAHAALALPSEPDHALQWVSGDSSASTLTSPSHRWAVAQWLAAQRS